MGNPDIHHGDIDHRIFSTFAIEGSHSENKYRVERENKTSYNSFSYLGLLSFPFGFDINKVIYL